MYPKLLLRAAIIYATSTSVVMRGWLKSSRMQRRNWANFNYHTQLTKLRHRIRYSYVCSISQLCTENWLLNRAWLTFARPEEIDFARLEADCCPTSRFKKNKKQTHVVRIGTIPQATHEHFLQNWPGLTWSVNEITGFLKPKFSWSKKSHECL